MGRTRSPRDGREPRGRTAARLLAQCLVVLVGLGVVALSFVRFVDAYDRRGAYLDAPVCGSSAAPAGADCVRVAHGRVIDKYTRNDGDATTYELTVAREQAPTATYEVDKELYRGVQADDTVELRLWQGRVASLGAHGTWSDQPSTPWLDMLWVGLLAGAGTSVAVSGLAGRRLAGPGAPLVLVPSLALVTLLGGGIMLTDHLPFALVLGLSVAAWLVALAVGLACAVSRDR